ncbi:MAG: hypothetical protein Q8N42_00880 [bacterium]|nr:hypothetical protein [bacterium]
MPKIAEITITMPARIRKTIPAGVVSHLVKGFTNSKIMIPQATHQGNEMSFIGFSSFEL